MSMNKEFEKIPQEKFQFVQLDTHLHDKKLETKARSFFADAMLRFSKNKSSVVAAWILLFLLVFWVWFLHPFHSIQITSNYFTDLLFFAIYIFLSHLLINSSILLSSFVLNFE